MTTIDELKSKLDEEIATEKAAIEKSHAAKGALAEGTDDRKSALQKRDDAEVAELLARKATSRRTASEVALREAERNEAAYPDVPEVAELRAELAAAENEYAAAPSGLSAARRQTGRQAESVAELEEVVGKLRLEARVKELRARLPDVIFAAACSKGDRDALALSSFVSSLEELEREQVDCEERLASVKSRKRSLINEADAAHRRFKGRRERVGDEAPALPDSDRATAAIRYIEFQRRAGQAVDMVTLLRAVGCSASDVDGLLQEEKIGFAITGRRVRPKTGVLEDAERHLAMARDAKRRHDAELAKKAEREEEDRRRHPDRQYF
jgi:hypothetical protein